MAIYRVCTYQAGVCVAEHTYGSLEAAQSRYDSEAPACMNDAKRGVLIARHTREGWEVIKAFTMAKRLEVLGAE